MKETTNVTSGYLCHCLRITTERFEEMLEAMPNPSFAELKKEHGIGSLCSSCEYEAKGVLHEYVMLHPEKTRAGGRRPEGLREELGYAWGELKKRMKKTCWPADRSQPAGRKSYHTGIFFMRRDGLESHLAVSNLAFPEHPRNVNGEDATFRATLYGERGEQLAVSRDLLVKDGQTLELSPAELFPEVNGEFTGGLYLDYDNLVQTGSLRPYGVMISTTPDFRARCHYHDKFGFFRDPGFFQNTSPFEPGQTCWMAAANCQPQSYDSDVFLKIGGEKFSAKLHLDPMASTWIKLEDLFPAISAIPPAQRSPALLWLENPQHVMLYFYWFNEASKTWMGQHH
jgi:bacterioferritin-associated ferredoxin